MKKTLVAIAALAATGAMAQSSVTVYGLMDAAYKNYTLKNAQGDVVIKSNGVSDGTNAGPRLGFKGTEDLGNGTAANFVFEAGMTVADPAGLSNRSGAGGAQVYGIGNTGNLAEGAYSAGSNTRQAYVSAAKAGVGELRVGYQYTALYDTSTNSGFLVGMEQAGGILHTMSNAEFGGTRANGLVYVSPKIAGTTEIRAYYGAGTGRETNESDLSTGEVGYKVNNAKRQGLAAVFEQGQLRLGAAYTTYKVEQTLGTSPADTQNAYGVKTAATKAQSFESKLTQLNASYDFGMIKPVVQYIKGEKDLTAQAGNTTANGLITATVGKYDYTATTYGATVPFGAATFFVMGGNGKITSATATLNDYKQTQYGVRYALSKRTTAYVAAGNSKDTQAATTAFGKNSFSAIGLTHSF